MDIGEVRTKKQELEVDIKALVTGFEKATETRVDGIHINRMDIIGTENGVIAEVIVSCKL